MRSGWVGRVRLDLQGKVSSYTIDGNWRIVWYTNQDIGQVTICSKTLWHLCGKIFVQSCVAELCSRTVWRNCVAELWWNCVAELCSITVWQNSTSVAELCGGSYYRRVWCPWQPASQQPPAQQDAISAFPVFSFSYFSLFFHFIYVKFSQESSSSPRCLT